MTDAEWIKSPAGRRVVSCWADPRPAWLWSGDGATLIWRNGAARYFLAKVKKHGLKLSPDPVPIRGQVSRLIRLGTIGRPSLSRLQLLAGERPVSATCACTPLPLASGQTGLLIVGVDPIEPELLPTADAGEEITRTILPSGTDYVLLSADRQLSGGSEPGLDCLTRQPDDLASLASEVPTTFAGRPAMATHLEASATGAALLLIEYAGAGEGPGHEQSSNPAESRAGSETTVAPEDQGDEPPLPLEMPRHESSLGPFEGPPQAEQLSIPNEPQSLSSLFDRLAGDAELYRPLDVEEPAGAFQADPPAIQVSDVAHLDTMETPGTLAAELTEPATEELAAPETLEEDVAEQAPALGGDDWGSEPGPAGARLQPLESQAFPAQADEYFPPRPVVEETRDGLAAQEFEEPSEKGVAPSPWQADQDEIAALIAYADEEEEPQPPTAGFRIIGRGFTPLAAENRGLGPAHHEGVLSPSPASVAAPHTPVGDAPDFEPPPELPEPGRPTEVDADAVERASRYNFDELSRILNDRVGAEPRPQTVEILPPSQSTRSAGQQVNPDRDQAPLSFDPPAGVVPVPAQSSVVRGAPEGALVNLAGETFILNRLPLGILVFRDQQVLFANRAITDMIGYATIDELRSAGLASIFPSAGDESQEAGPVNHLVRRDGALLPVTARLQSISWQGRPALMLSASATEVRTGHEGAVRAFAEHVAEARMDGFIETTRTGVISAASPRTQIALRRSEEQLLGRPVSTVIDPSEAKNLNDFFNRPARFAETARPTLTARGVERGTELLLFAQGQAGVVTGYFGFVRRQEQPAMIAGPERGEADPALLGRFSRSVRRPLNTVVGFADLIQTSGYGKMDNQRYLEYARDIKTAGQEIAALIDELDDFARLRDGRYAPRPANLDLAALLESCVVRVRPQANAARVLVRSAISERLPRIRADRASLGQAVLNLLASAIDQTPPGASVVLSAQWEDDGSIAVHVRDSGGSSADVGERFVVFRDGLGRDGEVQVPVRSSVGLALTRSLLAVNTCSLSVDPAGAAGTLFSLVIPSDLILPPESLSGPG